MDMKGKSTKKTKNDKYEEKILPILGQIEEYIKHGCTEKNIYEAYGIGKTTWFRYKRDHMELMELLYNAKKYCELELVNLAYKIANGYFVEEVTTKEWMNDDGDAQYTVTTKKKYIKPEPDILKFILINRYPDEWKSDPSSIDLRARLVELQEKMAKEKMEMEGI